MRAVILTDEEKEILEAFEKGDLVTSENATQIKKELVKAAKHTLNKTKNINIRLSEKDLIKAKAKASETGIPYQTLISSVIHQFVNK
ncbi:MAG: CopG family antitoxin [Patescibacteria group bacterium]